MSAVGTLPFNKIPSNWRLPLFFVEFDNTQANTATAQQRTLLVGQITPSGTTPANVPVICTGVADAKTKCGAGSMLAEMMWAYRQNDAVGEVWLLPLADDGAAVKAAGTLTFTAAATSNGTLYLYIAGQRIVVAVTSAMTTTQIAAAVAAAIVAGIDLPVTATSALGVVTVTAKNGGLDGNDIDMRFNYGGVANGEALPAGLAVTIVALANGATNPVLTTALANCVDKPFDFICNPYVDTTSMNAFKTFLDDVTGRWSFNRQVYGHSFSGYRGTLSAVTTFGAGRNNQHESVIGFYDSPSPIWKWAAACYGAAAVALKADPGRPMQTLVVNGILPPPAASRFASVDREALVYSGISTFTVADDGTIALEKVITTYQTNSFGQPDNSYLGIEVMFQLMFLMRDLATYVTSKYPRVKLARAGTRLAPGTGVVTTDSMLADMVGHYRELEYLGRAQNADLFEQNAVLVQDPNNPNRVNFLWAGTLMDQLNVFATLAQFRNF